MFRAASMGPELFSSGDEERMVGVGGAISASMGPELFSSGDRPRYKPLTVNNLQGTLREVASKTCLSYIP